MKYLGSNRYNCKLMKPGTGTRVASFHWLPIWKLVVGVLMVVTTGAISGGVQALGTGPAYTASQVQNVSIYMYDGEGDAVDVTGSTQFQLPHVVDLVGNIIGYVDSNYMIIDSSGNTIGYIVMGQVPAAHQN